MEDDNRIAVGRLGTAALVRGGCGWCEAGGKTGLLRLVLARYDVDFIEPQLTYWIIFRLWPLHYIDFTARDFCRGAEASPWLLIFGISDLLPAQTENGPFG